jgi:hypothetical protein
MYVQKLYYITHGMLKQILEAMFFNSQLTPGDKIISTCCHFCLQIADSARCMIFFFKFRPLYVWIIRDSAYLHGRLSNLTYKIS